MIRCVSNLWRDFRTDETCDSCKLCSEICPTGSIQIVDNKPAWLKTCEQCMRCIDYCPKQAIFQKGKGSVKGKNIYYEPSLNPLKLKKQKASQTYDPVLGVVTLIPIKKTPVCP